MSTPALPLSDVVDVVVLVGAQAPSAPTFNQGCITGTSTHISPTTRVKKYTALSQMATDGFLTTDPEYIAASILISQAVPPQSWWVGRRDLTSINTYNIHSGNLGTGYVVGDVCGVTGVTGAQIQVTAVNGSGGITGSTLLAPGTGATVANAIALTGGSGTGAEIDVTVVGDTCLYAMQQIRAKSSAWWAYTDVTAQDADHLALAAAFQSLSPVGAYFFQTSDAAVAANSAGNLFATLATQDYTRTCGIYSTTQSGAYPNNIYAAVAMMGNAMGLNTGLANSAFTLFAKSLVGITTEPISETTYSNITGNSGNVYVGYGQGVTGLPDYQFTQRGTTFSSSGNTYLDQILFRDMLSAAIQFNVMNSYATLPKVPQTDPGQAILLDDVNQAAQSLATIGFIGPGTWRGVAILNLLPGQTLPNPGFLAQSPPYNTQSQSDKNSRKSMPIYLAINEAGAAQSTLIGVYDQT